MPNHTDFNGDGRDDILWRTNGGGAGVSLGQLNGGFLDPGQGFLFAPDRQVVATGDFNGDGRDDALLRSSVTGNININTSLADFSLGLVADLGGYGLDFAWNVVGTGDFNGDGRDDLLLRHDNGTVTEWLGQPVGSAGSFFSNHLAATYALPAGWNVAGTGDFNGDGKDDVLLRHDNGTVTEWLGQTEGRFFSNHVAANYSLPAGWHVVGTGDFNGDSRDDVLLRHENGTVTEWLGGPGGSLSWNAAATYALPLSWHVVGIGNFNGDTRDDLLLRNDFGAVTDWLGETGGTFFSNHSVWSYDFFDWTTQVQPNPSGAGIWDY